MKIGFIGLGAMGRPMALNLHRAGHELRVHDVRAESAAELVAEGAIWASSAAEIARASDVVFTCLPGPAEVDAIALDKDGLLASMRKGSVWFDLTTNDPGRIRSLHAKFAERGVDVLDAPASGGPANAMLRKLVFWVGGDAETYSRFRPLLSAMGEQSTYIGPIGSGCVVKLVHNSANFTVQIVLAETFTLGVKAGVDPLVLFKALQQGTLGRNRTFDRLTEQFLSGQYEPAAFALRLAHKDMDLALNLGRSIGVPLSTVEIAAKDMTAALTRGWADRDARIAMTIQEERAGVSVKLADAQLRELAASD